jgi:hypothetical protein
MLNQPKRFAISSDGHELVGRIFDQSIVGLHFDSYEAASSYPDVKYVLDVNDRMTLLFDRVESLNHVGDLLWPKSRTSIKSLPVSAYNYCNLIQDVFLMRLISVLDCCCLLAVEVLELNVDPRRANPGTIRKLSKGHPCCDELERLSDLLMDLRTERNFRFHRGEQEPFTDDDVTFRTVAVIAQWGRGVGGGMDIHGRKVNLRKSYNHAINHLRIKFSVNVEKLSGSLDDFYTSLLNEFKRRWRLKHQHSSAFNDTAT